MCQHMILFLCTFSSIIPEVVLNVMLVKVFGMTQPQITAEIVNSQLTLEMEVERGTFIVPSFDEIWPQAGKDTKKKAKRMGMEYILEAMQHHGLGHLPQPDNFTTCGRLGIEINQYNNPVECYHDDTIEEMRDEKIILDHPELADKIKGNTQVWLCRKCNRKLFSLLLSEAQGADQPHGGSEAEGQQLRPQEERRPHGHQCSVTTNKKTFAILNFDQINTNSEL